MAIDTKVVEEIDGKEVIQVRLRNRNGVTASFLTLGATWQEFLVPTEAGEEKNLLLGFDLPSDYGRNALYAAQTIGRVAGRIAKGQARIDGQVYQLPVNNNANCLHGGPEGFHKQIWDFELVESDTSSSVIFTYKAKQEVDGFPGDMDVVARFTLDDDNRLTMVFTGKNATETTLFNPTTHPYFNLSQYQDLRSHYLQVQADYVLETDDELIPSGAFCEVAGTPYDFREEQNLSAAISRNDGFDDAFVVNSGADNPVVVLRDEESGDQLSIYSERQGVVVYTMNSLEDGVFFARDKGLLGRAQEGVAIEPQHLPDAVNHEHFEQIFLSPNEEKSYEIVFVYDNTKY